MIKHQKQIELNELLRSSRIHEAIELLESNLKIYERAQNSYLIQMEILEIHKTITKLKYQLQDLSKI